MIAIAEKQDTVKELQYSPHLSLRLFHESSEPHRAIVGQVGAPGQSEIDFPQYDVASRVAPEAHQGRPQPNPRARGADRLLTFPDIQARVSPSLVRVKR